MNTAIFFSLYNLAYQSKILDKIFIFFAEYLPYIAVILVLFSVFYHYAGDFELQRPFYIIRKRFNELFLIFTPAILGWVIVEILKDVFAKPRPFIKFADTVTPLFTHGSMDSFPSGHATFFGALAFSLLFVNKKIGYSFILFALLIGISRIISGVHFPVDILCGYILGIIIVLVFRYFSKKNKVVIDEIKANN